MGYLFPRPPNDVGSAVYLNPQEFLAFPGNYVPSFRLPVAATADHCPSLASKLRRRQLHLPIPLKEESIVVVALVTAVALSLSPSLSDPIHTDIPRTHPEIEPAAAQTTKQEMNGPREV